MTMRIVALAAAFAAAGSIAAAATATAKIDGSLLVTSSAAFSTLVEDATAPVVSEAEVGAGGAGTGFAYAYDFIQAEALADALSANDAADASVELDFGVTFFNLESTDVTLTIEYNLELFAEALAGGSADAFAQAFFGVGGGNGFDATYVALADKSFGAPRDAQSLTGVAILNIAAGGSARFDVFASVDASASIAPIPLPAAAPMMLLALGGLVALRRRA